jgi:hypothetical protein
LVLVEETAAFLTGRLLQVDGATPVWARLNWLAHARPLRLVHQREAQRQNRPEQLGSWARTRSDILEEVVDLAAGHPECIEHLQRACLIPL